MTLIQPDAVDAALAHYSDALGESAPVYRNHVMRGLNYQALLLGDVPPPEAVLAWIAHDLGIWSNETFDYLEPSARLVDDLAGAFGSVDTAAAKTMVFEHHKLRPHPDWTTETFRRADLVDVSRGLIHPGISRADVRHIVGEFPYRGFHRFLAKGLTGYAVKHPTAPTPMLRW
ncbi:hypothetical protein [Aldersonia kunmingensis]|uniref:hypothetical protein n=1 Tax=Aldersonia kunmingensis TaxID=408066 RepID=UPI000A06A3F9|nr:hypothetical protein [Aldersonia kunmingensis]